GEAQLNYPLPIDLSHGAGDRSSLTNCCPSFSYEGVCTFTGDFVNSFLMKEFQGLAIHIVNGHSRVITNDIPGYVFETLDFVIRPRSGHCKDGPQLRGDIGVLANGGPLDDGSAV